MADDMVWSVHKGPLSEQSRHANDRVNACGNDRSWPRAAVLKGSANGLTVQATLVTRRLKKEAVVPPELAEDRLVAAIALTRADQGDNHSASFDQRRSVCLPLTAIASARFCPTSTTRRLPRVMPV
jgi:hypothetical protein